MKALVLAAVLAAGAAPASGPGRAADAGEEAHAHALFRQIRCVVCQNESIDDSEAPLAADLRTLVRADLAAGRTDAQVKRALVDRYGEFVLLRPRLSAGNAALWLLPFGVVAAGLAAFGLRTRAAPPGETTPLSAAESTRVEALAGAATVPPPPRPKATIAAM